ncbi:hypothetical protein IPF37_01430 [bacterium]|nr:MAG: hypothetical protein IPF37_01430 [bacterium]
MLIQFSAVYGMPPANNTANDSDESSSSNDTDDSKDDSAEKTDNNKDSQGDDSSEDESGGGPETVELPADSVGVQGNWMKKKDWLIRAHEVNTQVRQLLLEIQGARTSFNQKYTLIDTKLDTFYRSISTDQGKLNELFDSLEKYLKKKKKQELEKFENANSKEQTKERYSLIKIQLLEEDITRKKTHLRQLKLDLQSIEDLDKSITQRLKKVDEEIKNSIEIASQTRKMMEDLWTFIDHKKAEAHYYKIKNDIFERLNSIKQYLNAELLRDFDKVSNAIETQMQKTKAAIDELEKEGFIIKDRTSRIEKIKVDELLAIKMAQEKDAAGHAKKQPRHKKPTTWYGNFYDNCITLAASLYYKITHPVETLFGQPAQEPKKESANAPVEKSAISKPQMVTPATTMMPTMAPTSLSPTVAPISRMPTLTTPTMPQSPAMPQPAPAKSVSAPVEAETTESESDSEDTTDNTDTDEPQTGGMPSAT